MSETIYWYDFETTGTDSIADRAIQFAGVRTDYDLNVLGEPLNLLCRPGSDTVPDPEAIKVTGIRMSDLEANGMTEADFCAAILEEFTQPQTCVAGFNSIRFDDEFMRQMSYRNFFDPYAREWQGGNSRWDVIDMFRMAYALRPEGMEWVVNEGVPSFRLELMTAANGVNHEGAHDAVADVLATIEITRLLKNKQPRLYQYLFSLRSKKQVLQQLYPLGKTPLIHVSSMYPAAQSCLAVVVPLCVLPGNSNAVVCYDLSEPPDALIRANALDIERLVFTSSAKLGADERRIPLKTIHINRCPAIAPMKTMGDSDMTRLGIDIAACEKHMRAIQQASGIVEKISEAFSMNRFEETDDPDFMLYQGDFFSSADVAVMHEMRLAEPGLLKSFSGRFQDPRLDEMLFRYRARNYPETLDAQEATRWRSKCAVRINDTLPDKKRRLEVMLNESDNPALRDLAEYYERLQSSIS